MLRNKSTIVVMAVMLLLLQACASKAPKNSKTEAPTAKTADKPTIPEGHIWVSKPDGSKSCGMQGGMTPEQAVAELKKAGIKVFGRRSGQDGMMHMMVCGAATGMTVDALIDGEQYSQAEKLGYKLKN